MSAEISEAELRNRCSHPRLKQIDSDKYEGEKGAGGKCKICGEII